MSQIAPHEENLHAPGEGEGWQESCVVAWRDPVTGLAGHHRIGNFLNQKTSVMWAGVFLGKNRGFRLNLEDVPLEMDASGCGMKTGPQRIFHDGTGPRLELDTPECTVRLMIEDLASPVERIDASNKDLENQVYADHFNIHCRLSGEVVFDGQTFRVDGATGWRDHSRGVRDFDYVKVHRGFHGNFGPGLDWHLLSVLGRDGTLKRRGTVQIEGVTFHSNDFEIAVAMMEDGITPLGGYALVRLDDGRELRFDGNVQRGLMGVVQNRWGFYSVGEATFEGRSGGYFHLETHENAMQGKMKPMLSLGALLENGLS